MARWLVLEPCYLSAPEVFHEYTETDRDTGRKKTVRFPVPLYIDPKDPGMCNRDGDCIVAHEGSQQRFDILFTGEPIPAMEPLDDEAREISEKLRHKWTHPIETLPANGGATQEQFLKELAAIVGTMQPASIAGPAPDEVAALKKQLAEQAEAIQALREQAKASGEAPARRSVG